MLIMSRKKNEALVINHDITVTVIDIRGDKVRLGIESPPATPVHRLEVWRAIHGWNEQDPSPPPDKPPPALPG